MSLELKILKRVDLFPNESEIQIARAIFGQGAVQQRVNSTIRKLVHEGRLVRIGSNPFTYTLGNYSTISESDQLERQEASSTIAQKSFLDEDTVKTILGNFLQSQNWQTTIAMGRTRGIDIDAKRDEQRWIIEVKGAGKHRTMQGNYFVSMLGELIQRMDDPHAKYSIALPDLPSYRGLWQRLPCLAKERLGITCLFVSESDIVEI